jgi:hypothetical protein
MPRWKPGASGSSPRLRVNRWEKGKAAWWTDGSQQVAPCLAVCRGLPAPTGFAALLDGRWAGARLDLNSATQQQIFKR